MRLKYFTIISAAVVLAACASEPKETTATSSAGSMADAGGGAVASTPASPTQEPRTQVWPIADAGDRVFFHYDRSELTSQARETVEKVTTWMQTYPDATLTLEGHADERGTREYNLALGQRRATAVRNYMEALGVDGNRLSVISYGYERPEALGSNESAWAQNRRTVFVPDSLPRVAASGQDRLAVSSSEEGERSGALKPEQGALNPGQAVVEATSGSTGNGLGMVCRGKGYPQHSIERRKVCITNWRLTTPPDRQVPGPYLVRSEPLQ